MSASAPEAVSAPAWKSYALSLFLHALVLAIGSWLLVVPPQFDIAVGEGGAAGRQALEAEIAWTPAPEALPAALPKPESVAEASQASVEPAPAPIPRAAPAAAASAPKAKAHASTAAASPATAGGSGTGAQVAARPNYRRNPPPAYPAAARQRGEQGLVLLQVRVDARGRAVNVALKQSSGFSQLDAAALSAVRGWQFYPATMGGVPIESSVLVPVRFRLDH